MVALAAAVVMVFLGPALDHRFAERQHDHSHTFLTATAASHGHPELHPFEESSSGLSSLSFPLRSMAQVMGLR